MFEQKRACRRKKAFASWLTILFLVSLTAAEPIMTSVLALAGDPLRSDLNLDGIVNLLDLSLLATGWASRSGDQKWNPRSDLNGDGIVNVIDMILLANDFGMQTANGVRPTQPQMSLQIGVYAECWNFREYDAETIAKTFDMSQSWWVSSTENQYDAKMNQVHALNPSYKALVYRSVMTIYSYWKEEWNLAANNSWLLKDANGKYVVDTRYVPTQNYRVDVTNRDYQKWVANKIKSWMEQHPFFDGVMVDNGLKYSESEWEYYASARPINPLTKTYFTWVEIRTGYIQLLNEIVNTVGPSKLVLANGIWNGNTFYDNPEGYMAILSQVPQLSGVGSEGIFYRSYSTSWYTRTEWLQSLNMLVWVQDNFLRGHPERKFNGWVPVDSASLPTGTTREQLMKFGFCSMLLGIKYSEQNTIGFGKIYDYPNLMAMAQKLRTIDMIESLGDYYRINSTSVYARDFVKGKVMVNPATVAYTIPLDRSYTTLEGTVVSNSLVVNPHSGVLLLNEA